MQNKILILGGNGMAGHLIALYLSEHDQKIDILCRKKFFLNEKINTILWNEDFSLLDEIINNKYDLIINCIGLLNDSCDKDPAMAIKINSFLPHFLAKRKSISTKLIHLSTDCVFSGKFPPYNEQSIPDGSSIYDISKAAGELYDENNNIVFRNSIIGPDINKNGVGLFNWFMHQHCEIKGFDNWIWSGITTLELAKQIYKVINQNIHGLFHLTNNMGISKYKLLSIFNEVFDKKIKISKCYLDTIIDKTLITDNVLFEIPSYYDMVIELKSWIEKHKEIYCYE